MKIESRVTSNFWHLDRFLPGHVQQLARKNYLLWANNAFHPSLHVKQLKKPNRSVRLGDHYRAVRRFDGSVFVWEWIGTHEDGNKRY